MELFGARVLVVGATGTLGGLAAYALEERGAHVALAGRNPVRLAALARELRDCPARSFEAYDLDQCSALAPWAERSLDGLDGVLVAVGAAGFGAVQDVSNAAAGHLLTVNALCPMAVLRGAAPVVADKGFLLAVTGSAADPPGEGTADYTASKAALSRWLEALAEELVPRSVAVLDIRSPRLDTGFTERPVTGSPPPLPPGADALEAVRSLVDRIASA
ncbi:SDR family NAD(P)-dependent oxidoreductase [Streptomyces sp. NPDC041068]|uniref:SDR family NAD(P)-dependent oxidoreductase n=1 Tax=Streptomyces sp. NPDC041068 TaxID=3155130 RepID=UPI0033C5D4FE